MNIQRGFRDKLEKYVNVSGELTVEMQVSGRAVYDYCCFGIDAAGKLSDDRYMVFYNQPQSPNREICFADSGGRAQFSLRLSQLPSSVQKLVFTVSIDGDGTMGQIASHCLLLLQNGQQAVEMTLTGGDFHEEKAIISLEIYRKDVWRFAAVASGFNGGLGDLLREFGGEAVEEEAAPAAPPVNTVSSSPKGGTATQNSAISSPYGGTAAPNSATPSPYGGTATQNSAISSPYGGTAAPNSAMSSPYGGTAAPNSAMPSPYSGTAAPNSAMPSPYGGTAAPNNTAAPQRPSSSPAATSTKGYAIPSPQSSMPSGLTPPSTYPVPTAQGSVPPRCVPPPTYAVPTPQSSVPSGGTPPPTYSVPTGQSSVPSAPAAAQNQYTQPSADTMQHPSTQPSADTMQYQYTQPSGGVVRDQYGYPVSANPTTPVQSNTPQPHISVPVAYRTASPATPAGGTQKVSLEKKLQKEAPALVSLAKPLELELEKRHLKHCIARVGLVLDLSGSMRTRYRNGAVQDIVNKTLPLAVQFDDDGELDCWFYGSKPKRMPSVNMRNYSQAIPANWSELMHSLGAVNNEPPVMKEVIAAYKASRIPAYVLFITDGGVSNESKIRKILQEASHYPIFWQFVGVGGSNYGILERLDSITDHYVDNAGFFALDDFRDIESEELYGRLLNEFPGWLNAIRQKGML